LFKMTAKDLICNIVIIDAPRTLKARFKALCAREGKTYRDMLDELIEFYEKNKRKVEMLQDLEAHHL